MGKLAILTHRKKKKNVFERRKVLGENRQMTEGHFLVAELTVDGRCLNSQLPACYLNTYVRN